MNPHSRTTLDVDVGNSRIKWRLHEGALVTRGTLGRDDALTPGGWPAARADRVRVSSVASQDRISALAEWLESQFHCAPEFARTTRVAAGVVCGYEDPTRLGVDRWLAVLAARQVADGPFVVVDLGTAATIDFVRADGHHEGGFIVPGLRLMTEALLRGTADVHVMFDATLDEAGPGTNTADAVRRGIVLMLADFANNSIRRFGAACAHKPRVYFCGGDANVVVPFVESQVEIRSELVLDGLALALP